MGFRLVTWSLVLCLAATLAAAGPTGETPPAEAPGAGAAPQLRLQSLEERAGGVEVSFVLEGAFDERIVAKLEAGLEVTFRHSIQAQRRRPFWFDRTLAQKRIVTSAVLDTLTRQYTLRREINGGIVETLTTLDEAQMRAFMTRLTGVRLELPEDATVDERMEIRARTQLETRFFLFFPYEFDTGWARWPLLGAAGTGAS